MIAVAWGETRYVRTGQKKAPASIHEIILEVAASYGLSIMELIGAQRSRYIAWPRQEIMYRASKETRLSLPQIGRVLGDRDHTTIMYGIRRYEERMKGAGNDQPKL